MSRKPLLLILLNLPFGSKPRVSRDCTGKNRRPAPNLEPVPGGSSHTGHGSAHSDRYMRSQGRSNGGGCRDGASLQSTGAGIYIYAGIAGINGSLCYDRIRERLWKARLTVSEYQSWSSPLSAMALSI